MDKYIREAIIRILKNNKNILKIAIRQKAKFEGWLKFELASYLELSGMKSVKVESMSGFGKERSDISFFNNDCPYDIELKTPNTNWSLKGVSSMGRPITKNINSIIEDTKKLNSQYGIVTFVLFPIPNGDYRWETYLSRIAAKTGIELSREENCVVITEDYGEGIICDLVVCTYMSKHYMSKW